MLLSCNYNLMVLNFMGFNGLFQMGEIPFRKICAKFEQNTEI